MYMRVCVSLTPPKHISAQTCILYSSFYFSPTLKKQRRARVSFILLGIALHLDKCNTAGRMHRWINFRRYNAAMGQTRREGAEMLDGGVLCARSKKRELPELRKLKIRRWFEESALCIGASHPFSGCGA